MCSAIWATATVATQRMTFCTENCLLMVTRCMCHAQTMPYATRGTLLSLSNQIQTIAVGGGTTNQTPSTMGNRSH